MPVTAPADRRFLRAQVKPGRRQPPWRAWRRAARVALALAVLAWGGWFGVRAVAGSDALRVQAVVVAGNHRLSRGEALALVEGLRGQNILAVDLEAWRGRLLESPWVADAVLRRALPSTIEVTIAERAPLAIARIGEDLYLVDGAGAIIDEFGPRYADLDLPILDGLARGNGDEADARRAALASRLIEALRPHPDLAARLSQIDVSDARNAVVIVDQDTARVRLGHERFVERLRAYVEMAPRLREQVPAIDYVDLRFGERWVIGSQGGPVPAAGPRAAGAR